MCAHFLFFPSQQTRDFSSRWEIVTWHVKGHPSVSAHNWTVSDHQWSKALKLRIGFTLRMRNCVSSSWFERLRNSLFVLQKMILWSTILEGAFWAIIGFNETIRNWHEERYFTSFSRGIGIQFSTSNNTTSLNDHWLVYRHCAKLRKWYKAEKYTSSYKQATSLSPNQSASYMHLFSSTRKTPKEIGINENSLKSKRSKPTWFCRPSTELQRNREQRFKGWCHLPWLSDVEIRTRLSKFSCGLEWKVQMKGISANADPH